MQVEWVDANDEFPRLHWVLDEAALAAFSQFGLLHQVNAGEIIFEKDEPSFALYLVIEGGVTITSKRGTLAQIGPNHSFGEMGLLLDAPRAATAHAREASRVLELSRSGLARMLQEAPVWAARFYRVLAECLAEYLHMTTFRR
jgi:CRP-like cAMP-binding protein